MKKSIQPATRLADLKEYYFSAKLRQIAQLNAAGHDIISLGIGSPDMPPSQQTIEALCKDAHDAKAHGYQPQLGIKELRESLVNFYQSTYGVALDVNDEVQPLMGSKEGILYIDLALLNPGDQVLVPNPGYPTYTSVARMIGAEVIHYNLEPSLGWEPDFEALERMDLSRVKLMWINYPNMPTGARGSLELYQRIIDFGRRHGILIAHDNPYSLILNESPESILQIEGAKDVCLEMNSMSKSHNMAGWRIGSVAGNAEAIGWVRKVLTNVESGIFRPLQAGAIAAMNNPEDWHREYNHRLYAERRAVAQEIMDVLGCHYDAGQVGMFLWGRIPEGEESAEAMSERIMQGSEVFITPGFIFGSQGERYLRISLCCDADKLRECLRRIKAWLGA